MKTALLFLLSLTRLTPAHSRASVSVEPNRTQFFEYEHIVVTCEHLGSDQWKVWRYTRDSLLVSECGSGWGTQTASTCFVNTVKLTTSGVYWCESSYRESSSAVNITVTDRRVILQSPFLPVTQGSEVTLRCETKDTPTDRQVTFFKDDRSVYTGPTDHVTLSNVNKSHEGVYKCLRRVDGEVKESPSSWLLIKDDDADDSLTLTAVPESTQLSEYENLSLTCGNNNNNNNNDSSSSSFHVRRFTTATGTLSTCGVHWGALDSSGCRVTTVKPPDSGIYWCESVTLQRSSAVELNIYGLHKTVLLRSPIHPPAEGDNVTLRCQTTTAPFNRPAAFYKDGYLVEDTPTGHMTLYHISKSAEGVYMCDVSGAKSPPIRLLVKGDSVSSGAPQSLFTMIRCVVVSLPYFISTLFMVFRYRDIRQTPRPQHAGKALSVSTTTASNADEGLDVEHEPTIANVTTEHRF